VKTTTRRLSMALVSLIALSGLVACSSDQDDTTASQSITIATHDSWAMDKDVLADFTKQTGIKVKIAKLGDAGEMTNKLILTKSAPIADGVFGINNPLLVRALDNGILQDADIEVPSSAYDVARAIRTDQAAPIDYSDVCLNIDTTWFAKKKLAEPATLDDLIKPAYRDLFVAPGADTSSPGQAFLLATIAAKGDGWEDYWTKLMANGTKIVSGWTEAYETDFTAGGQGGTRPIVVSYSSSPPFTVPSGGQAPTTKALLDTCYRDVEYAGVLAGTEKDAQVGEFIQFMLGKDFQEQLPEQMYVYPIDASVALPEEWAKWAPVSPNPHELSREELTQVADLLGTWREIATR
jgi:thiamine transport system substrate-binding protein